MNPSRLEQLFEFLKEEPKDPFILYAIATEYLNSDEAKAIYYFNILLTEHENYIGTYYHAAKLYEKTGDRTKAEEIYIKGIEICRKENKRHALSELQGAYNQFTEDEE